MSPNWSNVAHSDEADISASAGDPYPEVVAVAPLVGLQQLLFRHAGKGGECDAVDLRRNNQWKVNSMRPNATELMHRLFTQQSPPQDPVAQATTVVTGSLMNSQKYKSQKLRANLPLFNHLVPHLSSPFTMLETLIGM